MYTKEFCEEFGRRLKIALAKSKISQRELAERVGVSHVSINRYANGNRIPKAVSMVKIAKITGVDLEWLLCMKE